jgi:hypothetical protein
MWWSLAAAVEVGPVTETATARGRGPRDRGRKEAWEEATEAGSGGEEHGRRNGDGTERKAAGSAGSAEAAASEEAVGGGIAAAPVSHSRAGMAWGRRGDEPHSQGGASVLLGWVGLGFIPTRSVVDWSLPCLVGAGRCANRVRLCVLVSLVRIMSRLNFEDSGPKVL